MKKTLFILCICLSLILSSCNTAEVEYCIYYGTSDGEVVGLPESDIKIKSATEKVFNISNRTSIEKGDDYKPSCVIAIGSRSYDLNYVRTYRTELHTSEKHRELSEIDRFIVDNRIVAEYISGTDVLLSYFEGGDEIRFVNGDLTENKAKELSETVIKAQYGEEVLSEYVFEKASYTDDESGRTYTVTYTKFVHGMKTNDNIRLVFNMQGELIGLSAKYFGVYKYAEDDVSSEQIKKAREALIESVSDDWTIYEESMLLIIDSLGDYYLEAAANNNKGQGEMSFIQLYINVK